MMMYELEWMNNIPDDSPFWDAFYDIENLLDYWQDDRIDHAFVTYQQWADMVIF